MSFSLPSLIALQNWWLAATLVAYALVQVQYITATPLQRITLPDNLPQTGAYTADQPLLVGIGPDEKEHFLYILSIAERGALPRPTPAHRTPEEGGEQYVTYQAQHPPLFYALAALVYKVTVPLGLPFVWYLLRTLCAVCGGFVIVLAARAARIAFPDRPFIGLAAGPFVAFLPMFGHMTGNLSNEPLAMALGAWAWLLMVRIARSDAAPTPVQAFLLGMALALAAITRMTALLWLPAALLILGRAFLRPGPAKPWEALFGFVMPFVVCSAFLFRNWFAYGTFFLRTFDRPLLARGTLSDFFGPGIVPAEFPVPVNAFSTMLWYASTAWTPLWLIQFYLPGGGVRAAANWQRLFLAVDVAALLLLFLHWSRCRSVQSGGSGEVTGKEADGCAPDTAGRAILWAAGIAVIFCLLALIQQQLFADWNVVLSAGRYIVAAVPATALLFLFALSTRLRSGDYHRRHATAALIVAAVMLAFDLHSALLVRRFYADNPRQPDVQPIATPQAQTGGDSGGGEE